MVRPACFDSNGIKSGVWSKEEDDALRAFVQKHGHHNWQKLPFLAGLKRSGKSCRLRWVNYLQPGLNKSNFSNEEKDLIIKLHNQLGNKWAAIAEKLPGRTDNDIKNHWHAHIKKHGKRARSEMGHDQEEQSFEMNYCKKSNSHQHETTTNVEAQGDLWAEAFDQRFFSNPFPEENFTDFALSYYETPTFSNSSDDGTTYDDHTKFIMSQLNFDNVPELIPEEEFFEFGLCHNNHAPTYDDRACFNRLYIDLPPLFSENFGLCRTDSTPAFSDSSDNSEITYDHGQLNYYIDLPSFPEDDLYNDLGLYYNDTPNSSDGRIISLDSILENHNEAFGFNNLERIWYFGDDV